MNQATESLATPLVAAEGTPSKTATSGYQIGVATTAIEVDAVREFWRKANVHPDSDPDFYALFTSLQEGFISPFVVVASRNSEPKAMLIGRLEKSFVSIRLGYFTVARIPVRQVTFLHDGFVGECSEEVAEAIVREVVARLRGGAADCATLSDVDTESRLFHCVRKVPPILVCDRMPKTTQHWRTLLPASLDEFLKRRSKKHRYWLRRIARVFEEEHKDRVEYQIVTNESGIEDFAMAAETVARTTYQRGLGVGFANTDETRRRLKLAAEKGWLKAYLIKVDGKPLAFWGGRAYKGVMYLEWTGYDPAYRKYELGTVLFLKMVEDLCRTGVKEIDYGTGEGFYKERFGDSDREVAFMSIYAPTLKGIGINFFKTSEAAFNASAKFVARKLKLIDLVKKAWRGKLAKKIDAASPGDSPTAAE